VRFVGKPSERMSNFWTVRFLKLNTNRISIFRTSLLLGHMSSVSAKRVETRNIAIQRHQLLTAHNRPAPADILDSNSHVKGL